MKGKLSGVLEYEAIRPLEVFFADATNRSLLAPSPKIFVGSSLAPCKPSILKRARQLSMRQALRLFIPVGLISLTVAIALALLPRVGANLLSRAIAWAPNDLNRKVGQLIMVGFSGASSSSPGFRSVIDNLQKGNVGGVLFLSENIANKSLPMTMVQEVRGCTCSNTPIIAIDEEGGKVER